MTLYLRVVSSTIPWYTRGGAHLDVNFLPFKIILIFNVQFKNEFR
jgi:hypothetical protein